MSDRESIEREILRNQNAVDHAMLVQLATTDDDPTMVDELISKDIPTRLRAFMILRARNSLVRIIRITETLQALEDSYMERVYSDREGMDIKSLAETIEVTSGMLERSINLVQSIINDKELNLVVENTTNIYNDNSRTTNNIALFQNQDSREKLREISLKLIEKLGFNPGEVINSKPLSDEVIVTDGEVIEVEEVGDVLE